MQRPRNCRREAGGRTVGEECMSEVNVHKVQPAWKKNALIDNDTYLKW